MSYFYMYFSTKYKTTILFFHSHNCRLITIVKSMYIDTHIRFYPFYSNSYVCHLASVDSARDWGTI